MELVARPLLKQTEEKDPAVRSLLQNFNEDDSQAVSAGGSDAVFEADPQFWPDYKEHQ